MIFMGEQKVKFEVEADSEEQAIEIMKNNIYTAKYPDIIKFHACQISYLINKEEHKWLLY